MPNNTYIQKNGMMSALINRCSTKTTNTFTKFGLSIGLHHDRVVLGVGLCCSGWRSVHYTNTIELVVQLPCSVGARANYPPQATHTVKRHSCGRATLYCSLFLYESVTNADWS